jgi:hypothetical protein|tara:strand:+ start:407 stop:664 length:258 start_codon:yes stop_codon:yes gene_type:complete
MKKLTDDELTLLQGLQKEFSQAKLDLGNTVLQQNNLLKAVGEIREKFSGQEKILMEKYGDDVTINLETGEVTDKVEPELTKVETE